MRHILPKCMHAMPRTSTLRAYLPYRLLSHYARVRWDAGTTDGSRLLLLRPALPRLHLLPLR